jgi:ATP-dependent DNA helicase RecG
VICGFANAEGGVLVIGRNDKGVVLGLPNAAKLMEDIPNKVRDILGILVQVNLREEIGKEYLEIAVEPYPYPVSYKGEYGFRNFNSRSEAETGFTKVKQRSGNYRLRVIVLCG